MFRKEDVDLMSETLKSVCFESANMALSDYGIVITENKGESPEWVSSEGIDETLKIAKQVMDVGSYRVLVMQMFGSEDEDLIQISNILSD